jgi:cation diffusion facilitator CzcD-associated flavoprotein CzcO
MALIGGGSSGIQILPNIQPTVERVDYYMRSRTWIPPVGLGAEGLAEQMGSGESVYPAIPILFLATQK